jgi:hypothetical protein
VLLRRVLESGTSTLLLLAFLFLPLLAGLFLGHNSLYVWARPPEVLSAVLQEELHAKADYLNVPFFILRTVAYFACWLLLAYFLNRWSAARERTDTPRLRLLPGRLSGPGLIAYALTITFASVDWVMSLEPAWYSTIYPVLYAVGQILTAFAFAVCVVIFLALRGPLEGVVRREHLRDLGGLLLAFILFWAYMQLSQFLLIWIGNLPEEIPWYLRRTRGGWQWVALLLVLFHFALPFLLLLFRDVKENGRRLAAVAGGLFVLRFLDVLWWIEPAYPHEGQYLYWLLDIAAVVAVGGVWLWWFLAQLRSRPLLPAYERYGREEGSHE